MQQIGRYEILEEIGRGAMGVVFKGRDPLIGRAVAVKTITSGVAESGDMLERFYREARAAGGLQHPNIVTIYEMAESGGAPFIAMEYLEGESLEKLIARKPSLALSTKLDYVVQACRALDFAHRRGVIHRDIKPANIVVTHDGVVKVVDFGIARIADTSKTQTGTLLGTLAYMSPEQLRGLPVDASCDIWAMGVVLYELIAYQRPFSGDNHAAVLVSILQDEPLSIQQLVRECPLELERLVWRALLKNEKERYSTMAELLKELESIASALPREAPAATGAKTVAAPRRTEKPAATQRLDMQEVHEAEKLRASGGIPSAQRATAQPSRSPLGAANATPAIKANSSGAKPNPQKSVTAARAATPERFRFSTKALVLCAALAVVVLAAAAVRQHRLASAAVKSAVNTPLSPSVPSATAQLSVPAVPAPTIPTPAPTPVSAPASEPSKPSVEQQQRQLIDLAHEAADAHDFKTAQAHLDKAAKLNGPLNSLIPDLRRQFNEDAYAAEVKQAAAQEQALWDQAMTELQDGHLDNAEKSLRDLLVLPAGGHHWADAERYVDQLIPQRRLEQQLWTEARMQASSVERGHVLKEIKALDEVMAAGGAHEQEARQMRDAALRQIVRQNARRNGTVDPTLSPGYETHLAQLESEFANLATKGDAAALEGLRELRTEFKDLADAGGPLAMDPRDYLNNLIPKAQKQIEDNLAAEASDLSANAEYERAVKDYDRAVATQNAALLHGRVLSTFQQIADSGGIRAKEAERYVHVLIPAALKKLGSQQTQ
jgi:eukaryotic-like serine/threonine-protein kinase